jgi:hypothetical protein
MDSHRGRREVMRRQSLLGGDGVHRWAVLPAEDDRQAMRRRERKGVWRGGVQRRFGCLL